MRMSEVQRLMSQKNKGHCSQAMESNESLQFGVFRTQNIME